MLNKSKCKDCFKFASNNNCLGYEGKLYLSKYSCCDIDKIVKDNTYSKAFNIYALLYVLIDYYDSKALDINID